MDAYAKVFELFVLLAVVDGVRALLQTCSYTYLSANYKKYTQNLKRLQEEARNPADLANPEVMPDDVAEFIEKNEVHMPFLSFHFYSAFWAVIWSGLALVVYARWYVAVAISCVDRDDCTPAVADVFFHAVHSVHTVPQYIAFAFFIFFILADVFNFMDVRANRRAGRS